MSHPAINLSRNTSQPIGYNFVELKSVDSTNNYAMAQVHAGLAFHGQVYFAYEQVAGKGQRGKSWATAAGENITMSIVLEPDFLRPMQQFALSIAIALGCYDFLKKYLPADCSIKWPNDIYWRDRKAGGILIESICKADAWLFAVAGIGININQVNFPGHIPNAVSLKQITGKTFDVVSLAKELCNNVEKRYTGLKENGPAKLLADYNNFLFKKNELVKVKKADLIFDTTIKAVNAQGQLLTADSIDRSFDFGEIEWIL